MKKQLIGLGVAALMLGGVVNSSATTITLDATNSGWYTSTGRINLNTGNYISGTYYYPYSGTNYYRNFFTFDLSSIVDTIISASFTLNTNTVGGNGVYSLYDVTTNMSTLTGGGGTSVYSDLGSGVIFGSSTISASQDNANLTLDFNTNAISSLNASVGGSFAFGGDFVSSSYAFALSQNNSIKYLTIETEEFVAQLTPVNPVPEPATMLLFGTGLVGLVGSRIRKKKQQ